MKKIYLTVLTFFLLGLQVFGQCPVSITVNSTNITPATCPSNGAFTINATVGNGATYQITNGPAGYPTAMQNSPTFLALLPGTYTVRVACQENPAIFTTTTFTIPSSYVQVAANSVVTNVCGGNTPGGTITTTASGSSLPFTYAYWQGDPAAADGSLTYSTTNTFTATAFGTYNVRTKDACGVFVTQQVSISNPYPANLCISNISLDFGNLTCNQLQDSIFARFSIGSGSFASLPPGGMDIDVYENSGTCANQVQGPLLFTRHYTSSSTNNAIKIPTGKNLLFVLRTPCGYSCTYCFTYNPASTAFAHNAFMVSQGCVAPGDPITYSIRIDQNVRFYVFPISWVIKNSAGNIVATYTANSLADLPYSFDGLPSDTYTSTATDACLKSHTVPLSPPSGTPNQLSIIYSNTFVGCSTIEGTTSFTLQVRGVMANFTNAVARIIEPSPNLVGTIATSSTGDYTFKNLTPGATYYFEIDNQCGQKDTLPALIPIVPNSIVINHTNASVEQLCGGTGNINVEAAYNGWGAFSYQIRNSANALIATGAATTSTYTNLPAGTYTITTTINGCSPIQTYSSQVTILPSGSGPLITKKLGIICEDALGNPQTTGSAIFSFIGAQDLKVEYKLSTDPDANYQTYTLDSDGSETITGLLANTAYTIRVTDVCGNSTVTEIAIGQLSPLSTTNSAHPCVGSPYTLGVPDMVDATYTWRKNGVVISTNRNIVFPSYAAGDDGTYICTVSIGGGCVTRNVTVLLKSALCGITLPIKLTGFTVQKIANKAKISWSTEEEINSSHFTIERSADGSNWNTLATVNAAGNSNRRIDYSIFDNAPLKGINYYRLKSVDIDFKYEFSAVKTALFKAAYTAEVAPNPAKNYIHVYMEKTNAPAVTIQLLNTTGNIVYQTTSSQSHLPIDVSGKSKGLYFVKVIDADSITVIKVILE